MTHPLTSSAASTPPAPSRAPSQGAAGTGLRRCLLQQAAVMLLAVLCAWAQTAGQAHAQTARDMAADLHMAAEEEPFRAVAERFLALAALNDLAGCESLMSLALRQRLGEANMRRVMAAQILPFFAGGGQRTRSVTVTRTTDAAGQQGFAYYVWWQPAAGGEPRPLTLYTVREGSVPVLANVVPDRLVAGRHP